MPPTADTRMPLILLTGFLGAGKTTLLLRWLNESPATGRRMGVVMNEFGLESVDSQLIQRPGLDIAQVSGGCLCCAGDDDIAKAVRQLAQSGRVDYLVVETSGLADPDNVIDVLTDPDLLPEVRLQAVVTVVDARWFARPQEGPGERVLAKKQIQFAQVLCLSKCDLISEAERDWVEGELRTLNAAAARVRLPFGLPELLTLLDRPPSECRVEVDAGTGQTRVADPAPSAQPDTHLHHTYQSVTWRFPAPVDRSRFEAFLCGLNPREVVRAKGFVRFQDRPERLFLFQTVFGHHVIEEYPAKPYPEPVAVLIGPSLRGEVIADQLRSLVFGEGRRVLRVGS